MESIVIWAGSYLLLGMWNRALRGLPLSSPDRYGTGFVLGSRYLDRSAAGFVTWNNLPGSLRGRICNRDVAGARDVGNVTNLCLVTLPNAFGYVTKCVR